MYIAGVVNEAVAVLFIRQANEARKTMMDFFDRARDDRRLEEGLEIAGKIEDIELRSQAAGSYGNGIDGREDFAAGIAWDAESARCTH